MRDRFVFLRLQGACDPFMSMANGGGKGSAPPAPDYAGAAQATAAGNLEAARATAAANRVNQVTPYGNLTYSINGKDSFGNDMYTATQTLSPDQQTLLDKTNTLNNGLMSTANKGLNYANDVLAHPGVDTSKLPNVGINPGQSYQDAIMSRLQPQQDHERQMFDAQMANQGIASGTEAYTNAKRDFDDQQAAKQVQAVTQGFNTGLAANQNAFQQQSYNQMQPINVINALRTGSQVQAPNYVSVAQQAQTAGPDLLGAAQATGQYNLNSYNAQQAASSNFMGGLMGMAGAGILKYSDERLKSNIKRIGTHPLGIGIYEYDIFGRHEIGVMAQEVMGVMPEAVIQGDDGFYRVNYGVL